MTDVRALFDRIAPSYDRVNRAMTLGLDRSWREQAVREVPRAAQTVLDLCAGTLDLSAEVLRTRPGVRVVAVDFVARMLREGRRKIDGGGRLQGACADVCALPHGDARFDAALCGFGVRNLHDRPAFLAEVRRVLAPGGVLVVLDLFVPEGGVAKIVHGVHTRRVVPWIGQLLSGDPEAYVYLRDSVDGFVGRRAFEDELRAAGFADVRARDVGFGTVSIVRAS